MKRKSKRNYRLRVRDCHLLLPSARVFWFCLCVWVVSVVVDSACVWCLCATCVCCLCAAWVCCLCVAAVMLGVCCVRSWPFLNRYVYGCVGCESGREGLVLMLCLGSILVLVCDVCCDFLWFCVFLRLLCDPLPVCLQVLLVLLSPFFSLCCIFRLYNVWFWPRVCWNEGENLVAWGKKWRQPCIGFGWKPRLRTWTRIGDWDVYSLFGTFWTLSLGQKINK